MDIWSKNKIFLEYVEVAIRFQHFDDWRKILKLETNQFENPDEKLMLLVLQTDCHLYLNDGLIGVSLDQINKLNLEPKSEQLLKYINAYKSWFVEGDSQKSYKIFYDLAVNYGDLHCLKRGQLIGFLSNSTQQQIEIAEKFNIEKCFFQGKYYYGMLAFAYGEKQEYKKAYDCIQKGLSIHKDDAWLQHSYMHNLFFTEQNINKCIEISENYVEYWGSLNAFIKSHNFWHLSLFYLENSQFDKVYSIYDKYLWNFSDQLYLENLINGIQLLWKLEINNSISQQKTESNLCEQRWETVCKSLQEKQYNGPLGYLMYNFLIYKTLLKFEHKEAKQYGEKLRDFCEKHNKKCIVIFDLLFNDKFTNLEDLYKAFENVGELLGSVEQLLIFQEGCCQKLIQLNKFEDALSMVQNLIKVRQSPIYQNWEKDISALIKK